jgi:hypothetical protein
MTTRKPEHILIAGGGVPAVAAPRAPFELRVGSLAEVDHGVRAAVPRSTPPPR